MLQSGMDFLSQLFASYFSDWLYPVLAALAALLVAFRYRTRDGVAALCISMALLVIFLNPLSCAIAERYTSAQRYVRVFWCIPFTIGIAYAATRMLSGRSRPYRVAVIFLTCVLLLTSGGPVLNAQNYGEATNPYKLPDEVVEVADRIESARRGEWESPRVLANTYLSIYLRQYDGNIRLVFGRKAPSPGTKRLFRNMYRHADHDFSYEEMEKLGRRARALGVDIIVLAKYQVQNQALLSQGYELAEETENYYIFRDAL